MFKIRKKCCEKKKCNKRNDGLALHSGVKWSGQSNNLLGISIYLVSSCIYFSVRIEEFEQREVSLSAVCYFFWLICKHSYHITPFNFSLQVKFLHIYKDERLTARASSF